MAKQRKEESTRPPLSMPPAADLSKIAVDAMTTFHNGFSNELESAIGMLFIGHAFGWKVVYITHSIATVRKYEKILGIVAKEVFPEETAHSDRLLGFRVAKKVSNFWKAVKGEHHHEGFHNREIVLD